MSPGRRWLPVPLVLCLLVNGCTARPHATVFSAPSNSVPPSSVPPSSPVASPAPVAAPVAGRRYERWDAHPDPAGPWPAGSGAVYDLRGDALRPAGWTSADAAGLPVVPGLVRYEEVAAGRIDHAIRVTVPRSQNRYVWPARHAASKSSDPALPPMGLRLRLKSTVDTSRLPGQARVIAQAMKPYGAVVADNGSAWYLSGTPDNRWNNDALRALDGLTGNDFEAVDESGLPVGPDSGRVR